MTNFIACLNWILLFINAGIVFLSNLFLGMNPELTRKLPVKFSGFGLIIPIFLLLDVALRLIFMKKPNVHYTVSIALYLYMATISIIYFINDNNRNVPIIIIASFCLAIGLFCAIYLLLKK